MGDIANQLYFHDTITTPDGGRWLVEIYLSPAPETIDESDDGVTRGAAEPDESFVPFERGEPEAALVPASDLPVEIRPHPGRSITRADIAAVDSESARWALLARRYPWLFADDPALDKPPATAKDIKRLERGAGDAGGDTLAADLAAVADIAGELVDADGSPVWGAQSRIAGALGVTNAGASNRARILAVLEEIGNSTSTTTTENAARNTEPRPSVPDVA